MPFPPTTMKAAIRHYLAPGKLCTAGLLLATVAGLALGGGTALPLPPALWPISPAAATELPADPDQAANMLLVEAIELAAAAEEESDAAARLAALQRAQDNLDRIVRDYPASHVAVQIVTGQTIGTFDPADLAEDILIEEVVATAIESARFCQTEVRACHLFDEASETAESIVDWSYRVRAFAAIIPAQIEAGLPLSARRSLFYVVDAADAIPTASERSDILPTVAAAHAALGMWNDASDTADTIADDKRRSQAWSDIARAQAAAGLLEAAQFTFADALNAAQVITDDLDRLQTVSDIALAQAQAGLLDEAQATFAGAVDTASGIGDALDRSWALSVIALAQARAGSVDEARRTLADAMNGTDRMGLLPLISLANAQASVGMWDDAIRSATMIRGHNFRQMVLTNFTREFLAMDSLEHILVIMNDALNTNNTITANRDRSWALSIIARAQAEADLMDEAQTTFADAVNVAHAVTNTWDSSLALSAIAQAQTETGLLDEGATTFRAALITAHAINNHREQSRALSAIALAQAEAGLLDEARATFADAINTADVAIDDGQRRNALTLGAIDQVRAGLLDDARGTADVIMNDEARSSVLFAIALAQARAAVAALEEQ